MHRIDTDGHVANAFSDGDPGAGVPGTRVDDNFMNAVQEELCAVVETCGGTLVKDTNNQVVAQMVSAATANKVMRRDAAGRAQVADPSAAADIATKGYVDGAGTSGTVTAGTGWTLVRSQCRKVGTIVSVYVRVSDPEADGSSNIARLPSGYWPATDMEALAWDETAGAPRKASIVASSGYINVTGLTAGRDHFLAVSFSTV